MLDLGGITGNLSGILGSVGEAICDELGLPEPLGDLVSLGVNAAQGNWLAVAGDAVDFLEDQPASGDGPSVLDTCDPGCSFPALALQHRVRV